MKLHELIAVPGATKAPKRKGRGTATGQGTTAGRGMNGQKSRSGGSIKPGFEGGQMPLYRRIPKRGFTNIWGTEYTVLNVEDLNRFDADTVVTPELMKEIGMLTEREIDVKPFTSLQLADGLDYKLSKSEEDEKLDRIAERMHWGKYNK